MDTRWIIGIIQANGVATTIQLIYGLTNFNDAAIVMIVESSRQHLLGYSERNCSDRYSCYYAANANVNFLWLILS